MAIRITPKFKESFLDIPKKEAHRISEKFDHAQFPYGYRGECIVSSRKDRPAADRVNLHMKCVRAKR